MTFKARFGLLVVPLAMFVGVAHAQTVSIQKTALWDAPVVDATHGAATSYEVRLDGVLVGSPTTTSQVLTFTTLGNHTITLVAVNAGGSSPPATLVYTVLPGFPSAPSNFRIVD